MSRLSRLSRFLEDRGKRWDKTLVFDAEYNQFVAGTGSPVHSRQWNGVTAIGPADSENAFLFFTGMAVEPEGYLPLALALHRRLNDSGISNTIYLLDFSSQASRLLLHRVRTRYHECRTACWHFIATSFGGVVASAHLQLDCCEVTSLAFVSAGLLFPIASLTNPTLVILGEADDTDKPFLPKMPNTRRVVEVPGNHMAQAFFKYNKAIDGQRGEVQPGDRTKTIGKIVEAMCNFQQDLREEAKDSGSISQTGPTFLSRTRAYIMLFCLSWILPTFVSILRRYVPNKKCFGHVEARTSRVESTKTD